MKKEVADRLIAKMEERKAVVEERLPDGELKDKKLEMLDKRIESFNDRAHAAPQEPSERTE